MPPIAQYVFNGVVTGGILAVRADAFSLLWRLLRFPNFAVSTYLTVGADGEIRAYGEVRKAQEPPEERERVGTHGEDAARDDAVEDVLRDRRHRPGGPSGGDDHDGLGLALAYLLDAERGREDVAAVIEVARTRGALVVDLLSFAEELGAVREGIDDGAGRVRDRPQIVLDHGSRRLALGGRQRERNERHLIPRLRGVRTLVPTRHGGGEFPVGRRIEQRRPVHVPDPLRHVAAHPLDELRVDREARREDRALEGGLVEVLGHDDRVGCV